MNYLSALAERIRLAISHAAAARAIFLSYIVIIILGGVLLNMPVASNNGISIGFLDAVFTSASAVCITGLVVVNTALHWSVFGKIVLFFLIQIGGIGFMTLALTIVTAFGHKATLKDKLALQVTYNLHNFSGISELGKKVILGTFLFEGIGAAILFIRFLLEPGATVQNAAANGIFHSVSAFCNAGIDIIGVESLVPYVSDVTVNVVISMLTIIGGIGFVVWIDFQNLYQYHKKWPDIKLRQLLAKLTLNSKIALSLTGILTLLSALYILVNEFNNPATLAPLSFPVKIMASLFQSVTLRTTGFHTIPIAALEDSTKLINLMFMLIGGSPASTAGGIKTVTMGVVLFSALSVVRGRSGIVCFGRSIPQEALSRALAVIFLLFFTVVAAFAALSFTESASSAVFGALDILNEVVTAATTVGHTTGLTPHLSHIGKIVIILCMLIGRLGPVTFAASLSLRQGKNHGNISYPDEKILVG